MFNNACESAVLPLMNVHSDEIKLRQLCPQHKQRHRSSCGYWPLQLDTQPYCCLLANRRRGKITMRTEKAEELCRQCFLAMQNASQIKDRNLIWKLWKLHSSHPACLCTSITVHCGNLPYYTHLGASTGCVLQRLPQASEVKYPLLHYTLHLIKRVRA